MNKLSKLLAISAILGYQPVDDKDHVLGVKIPGWLRKHPADWGKKKRNRRAELIAMGLSEDMAWDIVADYKGEINDGIIKELEEKYRVADVLVDAQLAKEK